MKATDLFDQWVDLGKDDGMEINHRPSAHYMLSIVLDHVLNREFSFLDFGCGNGWLVREVSQMKNCSLAVGIDGSENMIQKATSQDSSSTYIKLDLNNLKDYNVKFDILFSMEVIYYLNNPYQTISYIFSHLLKSGGCCVIGLDHYFENSSSLSWPNKLDVVMSTYSISKWKKIFEEVGFKNIYTTQFGKQKNWEGTLILYGEK